MKRYLPNTRYYGQLLLILCVLSGLAFGDFLEWAPTPPMGWNSWDCFGCSVTEEEVKANADYMARHLKEYGWEYIVVDIQWYEPKSNKDSRDPYAYPRRLDTNIDEYGRVWPAVNKHPSSAGGKGFAPLAEYVHGLGLKFGVHMMRGIPKAAVEHDTPILGTELTARDIADTGSTCPWNPDMYGVDTTKPGAQEYYNSLFDLVAEWGVDYVKIDDLSRPYHQGEVEAIRKAIDQCGRPIVFSTSPGATPLSAGEHVSRHANLWRISDDFWDQWDLLKSQFQRLDDWSRWSGDGHYPDADMLPLGNIRARSSNGWTRFTKTEQQTMMILWAIARSPLMMGGHMPKNDEYTLSLLTNSEVLYVNQSSKNNRQLFRKNDLIAWTAEDRNSEDVFVALINGRDDTYDVEKAAWVSPVISRKSAEKTAAFEVPLAGTRHLYLVVDDGGDGFACDHADWLEMVLTDRDGRETPLTELKWKEAVAGWGQVTVNRSVSGNGLSVGGVTYGNGLGTHSKSLIVYELPEDRFVSLEGLAALDDGGANQRAPGATVQFQVYTENPAPTARSASISVDLSDLGFGGRCSVRDLWNHKELGEFRETFTAEIEAHGAGLYRVRPMK